MVSKEPNHLVLQALINSRIFIVSDLSIRLSSISEKSLYSWRVKSGIMLQLIKNPYSSSSDFLLNCAILVDNTVEMDKNFDGRADRFEQEKFIRPANRSRDPSVQPYVLKTAVNMEWVESVLNR